MTLNQMRSDLEHAKKKAADWNARVREIERKITEKENSEIIMAVRGLAATPEELRALLNQIHAAKTPPMEQEETKHEE